MNLKRHIFEFILDNHTRWNYVPTRAEIRRMFAAWTDDPDLHLEQLEREGLLILGRNGEDKVAISPTFHMLPQLKVPTGLSSEAIRSQEMESARSFILNLTGLSIPLEPNMSALLVPDQSMVDAGIQQGDIALLQHACPRRGDIVAVELDGCKVLRRYVIITEIPHLLAENPFRPDLRFAHDISMSGVLWGSIRTEPCRWTPDHAHRKSITYTDAGPVDQQRRSPPRRNGSFSAKNRLNRAYSTKVKSSKKVRSKVETSASPGTSGFESLDDWPKPPSGVELNDTTSLEYTGNSQAFDHNERRPGWALEQAIKDYEDKEIGFAKRAGM